MAEVEKVARELLAAGELNFSPWPARFVIRNEDEELLSIDMATGEVVAPSIEAASEAGRVFVEHLRRYLPKAALIAGLVEAKGIASGRIVRDDGHDPESAFDSGRYSAANEIAAAIQARIDEVKDA